MKTKTQNAPSLFQEQLRKELFALLELSHDAWAGIVEKHGLAFAWHYTLHDEWSVNYLTKTASYWNWWKRQWNVRDEIFLEEYRSYARSGSAPELLELYLDHHQPEEVESYPCRYIMDEAWQLMLEDVSREKEGKLY